VKSMAGPVKSEFRSDGQSPGRPLSFDAAPRRVYWEVTRACSLACRHCRAEATSHPAPGELTLAEGRSLLERIAAVGDPKPHVVLTGGDPLERGDLFELIAHARSLGLVVAVSPSATPRLTPSAIQALADAGVHAISLSLDGATAARHDTLRGVSGCFERTLNAARAAAQIALSVQVNTLVSAETADDLPAVLGLVTALDAARWSLFFLVSVGRGTVLQPIDAYRAEQLLNWLASLPTHNGSPLITTTEAPHFRRVLLQRGRLSPAMRAGFGIRDGNGVMFISHVGDVSPSGFLPLAVGNVRDADVMDIYRGAPLFVALRHSAVFGGRCGQCRYDTVCGGSRARAWTSSGDPLGEDPLCRYEG
jgi:MoaA/NifB/PqqE/SkfB family radical SAM enzyme